MRLVLSLGTNLGNCKQTINNAIRKLEEAFQCDAIRSRFYESPPYGPQDQPNFINIALEIITCLNNTPKEILHICKSIEEELGRKQRYHWGPREIDIDIIFIDEVVYSDNELTIPHKEFRNRSFVLEPLKDLPSYNVYKNLFKISELDNNDATPLT